MNKRSSLLVVTFISAVLCGCAPVWVKPGATQNDFAKDKYDCLQQSQQRVSGAYVNAYGGASSNKVITNDGLFNACMNARGWTLQSQDSVQKTAAQNRQLTENSTYQLKMIAEQQKETCADPRFQAYYKKSPCNINDMTMAQLSDNSKVTAAQKTAIDQLSPALSQNTADTIKWQRTYGGPKGSAIASVIESVYAAHEKNRLNLYSGKITWGEYNQKRKDLLSEQKNRMNQIK